MIVIRGNPISVNALYRGRRFLTKEGKAIKEDYAWQTKMHWRTKPTAKRLELRIDAYFGSKRIRDIDNIAKAILDAFKGIVWVDDGQVDVLHIYRKYDKENPRMEIEVKELSTV